MRGAGRWRPLTVSLAGAKSDNENPVCTWCPAVYWSNARRIPTWKQIMINNLWWCQVVPFEGNISTRFAALFCLAFLLTWPACCRLVCRGFGRLLGQGRNHDVRLVSRECFLPPGILQCTYIHIQCILFLFINPQAANIKLKPNANCRPEHFFFRKRQVSRVTRDPCLKRKKPDEVMWSGISSR